MDEVSFALEERKTIIPIIHRDCAIPFRLRRLQHLDFRRDYARALNDLVRTLVSGTETVLARSAVVVSPGDTAEVPLTEQQRALEQTVTDHETRATEQAPYEARQRQLEQAREENDRVQAVEKERLTRDQRVAAEHMQRDDDQQGQAEHERLEQERLEQERRIAAGKAQRDPDHQQQIEEPRREDKRRQGAEKHRQHELEAAARQAQRDAGACLQLEQSHRRKNARAPRSTSREGKSTVSRQLGWQISPGSGTRSI